MKTKFLKGQQSGSVLMVTMAIIGVVGLALASYLTLAGAQNKSVVRSQTWNASIPVVEAGIEEAIMHLNKNCLANDITLLTPNWTADFWTNVADGIQMTRSLGTSRYVVTIVTTTPYSTTHPAIVSEGYVPAPFTALSPQSMFAIAGVNPNQVVATTYVGRKVRVTTGLDAVFVKGMVAKDSIDLSGNRISSDSFDSQDPNYSTAGQWDINKRKANGDIATNSKLFDSFNVGNAEIRGKASTGPGGLVSIGPNGSIGDLAWIAAGNHGIQPGHTSDDMNVAFQDVMVPFTTGQTPLPGLVTNVVITPPGGIVTSTNLPTNAVNVVTNTIVANSTNYPDPDTYVGAVQTNQYPVVTTNTAAAVSTTYPTNYIGNVTTNSSTVTTSTNPAAGTYVGNITTNTVSTNSTSAPGAGTYVGNVITNTTTTTTVSRPSAGTYVGNLTTNTTVTTIYGTTAPAAGTYSGIITTNSTLKNSGNAPNPGSYIEGTLVANWNNDHTKILNYDYREIDGYTYNKIVSYTYAKISSYTYNKISTYTYAKIVSYNYTSISSYTTNYVTSSYTYNRKKDFTYQTTVASTNTVVTAYDYILYDGDYKVAAVTGNVLVRGKARLYVTSDINITGSKDGITIDPNMSLKLYTSASDVRIAGIGVVNNGGNATNFYYFGLPSNTKLAFAGNASFTGVVYAPSAAFTLGGGGNDTYDFTGASVSQSVKMNGHFNFHYDENLGRVGSFRGYVIDSWNEIPLSQAK